MAHSFLRPYFFAVGSKAKLLHTYMKWVVVYFVGLFGLTQLLGGCNSPAKTLNLLTPDRIGIGRTKGVMSMEGFSHGHYSGGYEDNWHHGEEWGDTWSHSEFSGESEADMIWLEWELPAWKEPSDYDNFLRERVRTLQLEKTLLLAERSLKQQDKVIKEKDTAIKNAMDTIDNALRREGQEEMWPKKLTEQY